MSRDTKVVAGRTRNIEVDAGERRRARDRRARHFLHDWYVRQLLTRALAIPTRELPEALIIAKRLQLISQRMSQGRIALDDIEAVIEGHRSKNALYTANRCEMPDPP